MFTFWSSRNGHNFCSSRRTEITCQLLNVGTGEIVSASSPAPTGQSSSTSKLIVTTARNSIGQFSFRPQKIPLLNTLFMSFSQICFRVIFKKDMQKFIIHCFRSPRGDAICIWSTPLEYSCFVYTMDGRCIFQFSPTILGLGISSVIWSPCGNLLTLAGCDGKIRLVNTLNW